MRQYEEHLRSALNERYKQYVPEENEGLCKPLLYVVTGEINKFKVLAGDANDLLTKPLPGNNTLLHYVFMGKRFTGGHFELIQHLIGTDPRWLGVCNDQGKLPEDLANRDVFQGKVSIDGASPVSFRERYGGVELVGQRRQVFYCDVECFLSQCMGLYYAFYKAEKARNTEKFDRQDALDVLDAAYRRFALRMKQAQRIDVFKDHGYRPSSDRLRNTAGSAAESAASVTTTTTSSAEAQRLSVRALVETVQAELDRDRARRFEEGKQKLRRFYAQQGFVEVALTADVLDGKGFGEQADIVRGQQGMQGVALTTRANAGVDTARNSADGSAADDASSVDVGDDDSAAVLLVVQVCRSQSPPVSRWTRFVETMSGALCCAGGAQRR